MVHPGPPGRRDRQRRRPRQRRARAARLALRRPHPPLGNALAGGTPLRLSRRQRPRQAGMAPWVGSVTSAARGRRVRRDASGSVRVARSVPANSWVWSTNPMWPPGNTMGSVPSRAARAREVRSHGCSGRDPARYADRTERLVVTLTIAYTTACLASRTTTTSMSRTSSVASPTTLRLRSITGSPVRRRRRPLRGAGDDSLRGDDRDDKFFGAPATTDDGRAGNDVASSDDVADGRHWDRHLHRRCPGRPHQPAADERPAFATVLDASRPGGSAADTLREHRVTDPHAQDVRIRQSIMAPRRRRLLPCRHHRRCPVGDAGTTGASVASGHLRPGNARTVHHHPHGQPAMSRRRRAAVPPASSAMATTRSRASGVAEKVSRGRAGMCSKADVSCSH